MKITRLANCALTIGLLVAGIGCNTTPLRSYRTAPVPEAPSGVESNPMVQPSYAFTTIEFDDMGELWDEGQLTSTVQLLEQIKQHGWKSVLRDARLPHDQAYEGPQPVVLLVYVHGWNHNASEESGNFVNFHRFVKQYAASLQSVYHPGRPPAAMVATYIGWRGALYDTRQQAPGTIPPNFFSNALRFHNRKDAAERVAGPSATAAILSIAAAAKTDLVDESIPESRVILIGHSLGGVVVERAVSQAILGGMLIDRAEDHRQKFQLAKAGTDLEHSEKEIEAGTKNVETLRRKLPDLPADVSESWFTNQIYNLTNLWFQQTNSLGDPAGLDSRLRKAQGDLEVATNRVWTNFLAVSADVRALADKLEPSPQALELLLLRDRARTARNPDKLRALPREGAEEDLMEAALALERGLTNLVLAAEYQAPLDAAKESTRAFAQAASSVKDWGDIIREIQSLKSKATADQEEREKEHNARLENLISQQKQYGAFTKANKDLQQWIALRIQSERILTNTRPIGVRRPADLILLANPASEALTARKMISALQSNRYLQQQSVTASRPLVVSISADADKVTKKTFRTAMRIYSLNKNYRDDLQRNESVNAAPHVARLRSHVVERVSRRPLYTAYDPTTLLQGVVRTNLSRNGGPWHQFLSTTNTLQTGTTNGYDVHQYELLPVPGYNKSGYWVVQAPDELISGHNDIFSPKFIGLVTGLFRASGILEPLGNRPEAAPSDITAATTHSAITEANHATP